MYTILLNETNELTTSVRERIMQRSKLVDSLHFLVDPIYKGIDMSDFTVLMEYLLPVSREYKTEILVKSDALYKEKLEYKLPIDTNLTREAGKVEVQLTFIKVDLTPDGKPLQRVRKTSPTTITIVPITAWSDVVADSALTALDQRLIQVDAMLNAANEMNNYLSETKADNLILNVEDNTIQLSSNGVPIGEAIERDGEGATGGGTVFVPEISDRKILSWTIKEASDDLKVPEPTDLNPYDEWTEDETNSEYTWEEE
jgi:hypothetical protein